MMSCSVLFQTRASFFFSFGAHFGAYLCLENRLDKYQSGISLFFPTFLAEWGICFLRASFSFFLPNSITPVRKKSKKTITPEEKLENNNRKTRNERVVAQTDRLKKVKQSLVKSTTADFQKNLDEFIRLSCQNKIISSITANFNSSCNSSALQSGANSECNSEMGSEKSFVNRTNFNDTNLDATQQNSGMPYNNNIPCAVIVGGAVNFTQIADIFKNSADSEYKKIINFEPAHGKSQKNMLESLIEQAIPDPIERKAQGLSSTAFLTFSRVIRVLTHKFDGLQPIILNFFNVESFNGQVLSDFLDMLYRVALQKCRENGRKLYHRS